MTAAMYGSIQCLRTDQDQDQDQLRELRNGMRTLPQKSSWCLHQKPICPNGCKQLCKKTRLLVLFLGVESWCGDRLGISWMNIDIQNVALHVAVTTTNQTKENCMSLSTCQDIVFHCCFRWLSHEGYIHIYWIWWKGNTVCRWLRSHGVMQQFWYLCFVRICIEDNGPYD